jgi:hypothetical protein
MSLLGTGLRRPVSGAMDVFKLAFETTVVGLLTIGWLAVAAYLLFAGSQPDSVLQKLFDVQKVSDFVQRLADFLGEKNLTAVGISTLILAYCLGSAVLPISNQLVNDEHWPLNESAIRCQVFTKEELELNSVLETGLPPLTGERVFSRDDLHPRHCSYWAPVFDDEPSDTIQRPGRVKRFFRVLERFARLWIGLPASADEPDAKKMAELCKTLRGASCDEQAAEKDPAILAQLCKTLQNTACDEFKAKRILAIFRQQETAALSQPSDGTEGLRQLRERIVVLRGTLLSLFVFLLICLFAYFRSADGGVSHWTRPVFGGVGGVVALVFTVFAAFNGVHDLVSPNIFDIPVLECVLMTITIFGLVLVFRRAQNKRFRSRHYVLITLFFTGLAYGGWMWSEVLYDQQVIGSYVSL